jgi:hypothetical protein
MTLKPISSSFFTDDHLRFLCDWTNARAWKAFEDLQARGDGHVPTRLASWTPVTASEMQKFIGMSLYMGLVKKPEISLYWSKDPLYVTQFFQQPTALSRDRFLQISAHLRFYNCNRVDRNDSLAKVRPFIDKV